MGEHQRDTNMSGATASGAGRFVRQDSRFRDWVTADGSSGYPAEAGRYHLYVSLACPWAHRAVILRKLKGLEGAIDMSVVDPHRDEHGWAFRTERGGTGDRVNGCERPQLRRARQRAGAVGQADGPDRQQRVGGHHRDAQRRLRRVRLEP
jgi:putative glutathione S-transferase